MRKIKYIVIHHAAVDVLRKDKLLSSIDSSHKRRKLHTYKNEFGYHIAYHHIIWTDGTIINTRPWESKGNHAGNAKVNQESVGIMLAGNLSKHPPTQAQIDSLLSLVMKMLDSFGETTEVGFHKKYSKTACPGSKFPYDLFLKQIVMASKFKKVFEQEVKEPIFTEHDDNEKATIADIKYLIEIGVNRAMKKLYDEFTTELTSSKSLWDRVFSFLKLK